MIKKFCDICDKEIEGFFCNDLKLIIQNYSIIDEYEYDICPSCTEKIKNFISVLKKNG